MEFLASVRSCLRRIPGIRRSGLGRNIMMKYILRELFLYFLVSFAFFFMIFFVNQILLVAEELLSKRAPFGDVMRILFYSLPFIVAQSAPFATLVGFLVCLGRMMSDNEILIFRASGFSFSSLLVPVLALGFAISVGSFFVNDYLLPLGTIKYNRLYRQIMNSTPTVELEPHSVKTIDSSTVVIGDVSGNDVSDVLMFDRSGGTRRVISAGKSTLVGAKKEGVLLQLDMDDAVVLSVDTKHDGDYDVIDAGNVVLNVFDRAYSGSSSVSPREMTAYDLKRELTRMRADGNTDSRRLNVYNMEYYKKFALPFGSIFFAFLALSIAFLFGKHNGQTVGLLVGIVICVLYWAMQISGQLLVTRNGLDAFWSMWLPDFLMGGFGFVFYLVLVRK